MWSLCLLVACSLSLCLNGGSGAPVILAVQQGENVVPLDTLTPNHVGCLQFTSDTLLAPGQYVFVQNNRRLFNFLLSEKEPFSISFTATMVEGRTAEIRVEGSEENNAYFRFYQFLQDQYARVDKIAEKSASKEQIMKEIAQLEETTREYTSFVAERFEGDMLGIIAKNIFTPVAKPATRHYFDYVDFTDERILNTSILPLRLSEYLTNVVPPIPDSVITCTDRLLDSPMHPAVQAYCARYLFTQCFASDIMGMEAVAVHLAKRYFLQGPVVWGNAQETAEMEQYVAFNEQCLLGAKAPELHLPDYAGATRSLYESDAPYTLLFFFEDGCPVCSDEILKLVEFAKTYAGPRLQVIAIYTQNKEDVFARYATYFPKDWIVCWDPDFTSDFQHKYNVRGTPRFFLLDRQKNIIGRDFTTATLPALLKPTVSTLPQAANLKLQTETGGSYALYDVSAPYTVLFFYDPGCAACGVVADQLYKTYQANKDKGVEVYAVYTGSDAKAWQLWLAEGGYTGWINVWNANADAQAFASYELANPPTLYLLDAQKHIVNDHISLEALTYIMNHLM